MKIEQKILLVNLGEVTFNIIRIKTNVEQTDFWQNMIYLGVIQKIYFLFHV